MKKGGDDDGESDEDLPEDIETIKLDQILKRKLNKKKEMPLVTDKDVLQRFWGDDNELQGTDKFLRNYILLEGWKDKFKGGSKL